MFWCVTLSPTFFMFEFIILFRVFELTFFGILGQPSALSSKLIFPWLDKDPLLGVSSSRQLSVSDLREGRVACLGRSAGLSHLVRGIVIHANLALTYLHSLEYEYLKEVARIVPILAM